MASDPSAAFNLLRPFCVEISTNPSAENIKLLERKLGSVCQGDLSQLMEYILFPLTLTLQREETSEKCKIAVVECMHKILKCGKCSKIGIFDEILSHACMLLSSSSSEVLDISEEMKTAIVKCLHGLFLHLETSVQALVYSVKYIAQLGHLVSLLLSLSLNEKSRDLRLQAISCLQAMSRSKDSTLCNNPGDVCINGSEGVNESDVILQERNHPHVIFASFLPGITVNLCKIITGDTNKGHAVIIAAIDTFASIVAMVMNDRVLEPSVLQSKDFATLMEENAKYVNSSKSDTGSRRVMDKGRRNPENLLVEKNKIWVKDTGDKLCILLKRVASVPSTNWKVRLSLVKLSETLLSNCSLSLSGSVSILLELIVGFIGDEYEQVAQFASSVLKEFSQKQIQNGQNPLVEILEENLHLLMISLPRVMRSSDDDKKLSTLKLVVGYLSVLGPRVEQVLNSASHLKRLSYGLLQVLELDITDVKIVEERNPSVSSTDLPSQDFPSYHNKHHFKHLRDDTIHKTVMTVCRLLGFYGNLMILADHFVDIIHESKLHRKEAVLVLNEIVGGFAGNGIKEDIIISESTRSLPGRKDELQSVVSFLLGEFTQDELWHLPTSNYSEIHARNSATKTQDFFLINSTPTRTQINTISFQTLNSNIQQICLLVEGIGGLSAALGSDFERFLISVIYPLMEKLGDENAAISHAAHRALIQVCASCRCKMLGVLIARNMDYLVNAVSLSLRHIYTSPQALQVLRVMLQYSDKEVLPVLQDTLAEVFNVIDACSEELLHSLMHVLHGFVSAIRRWNSSQHSHTISENRNPQEIQPQTDICQFFLEYCKTKQTAMGEDIDEEVENDKLCNEELSDEFDDKKPDVPLYVNNVVQILEKCVHFLSASSPTLRLLVLDAVQNGVTALGNSTDQLLPVLHKLWPPLVRRFSDSEQVVTTKAVKVLCTMVEESDDFMKRRVLKEALPQFLSYLSKQSSVSLKAGPMYSHTQAYKLQLTLLSAVGDLCLKLKIEETECCNIAQICTQYLSSLQPHSLQEAAVETFHKLIRLEPDSMWLSLCDVYCSSLPETPDPVFKQIQLAGLSSEKNVFSHNVEILLRSLENP